MTDYIDQLTAMHMNAQRGHTSPHKAVMLLSVIDLIASGDASGKILHWAMDQELIFPCSDNRWHVRKDIDDRIDAHRDLINLNGKTILPPEQKQYAPKHDALLWREQRLKAG